MSTEPLASTEFDAEIEIQVSKRGAAWSFSLNPARSRSINATGKLPGRGATRHTLLAVGLTAALMAVHEKDWHRLRGNKPKPTVVINIPDQKFVTALEFRRKNKATPTDGFRVARNLLRPLYEQFRRFNVTLRFIPQENDKAAAELTTAERLTRYWWSFDGAVFTPATITK